MYFTVIMIALLIGSCAKGKNISISQSSETKTREIPVIIPISSVKNLNLQVGDSLNIPELELKLVKISATHYLAAKKETVVQNTIKEVEFVATKIKNKNIKIDSDNVDKSKDKSKIDSENVDKSKDKSRENSNNKTKANFPWWILIIIAIIIGFIYVYRKTTRYPFV